MVVGIIRRTGRDGNCAMDAVRYQMIRVYERSDDTKGVKSVTGA
jgi:hypothetical protein